MDEKQNLLEKMKKSRAIDTYSWSDKGFSALFADLLKDYCRYNSTAREWFFFNGKAWVRDTGAMRVSKAAKTFSDALHLYGAGIEDEARRGLFLKEILRFGKFAVRETLIKDARDRYFFEQPQLDCNLNLYNCQNGTLNLRTGEFKRHDPADMLSKVSNVVYNPEASSPLFQKFINDIMLSSTEKIRYLQKVTGATLTADTSMETCWMLYGPSTRNGKSTFVETIGYMHGNTGGYALSMQPQTLAQRQNKDTRQASGDIARLDGCRFLNASEPPKRMIFDTALLKTLLGRDTITARHLFEREYEFVPHFHLFINTNFLPLIQDDTLFSSGRINVITFDRHFAPSEQDRTLKDRLQSEKNISGIFNWCLEGLRMLREEGAEPPLSVTEATTEYRRNSDKIGNFIAECMQKTGRNSTAGSVYKRFQTWCEDNGFGTENKRSFFDELRGKGIFAETGTVNNLTAHNVVKGYELIRENAWV